MMGFIILPSGEPSQPGEDPPPSGLIGTVFRADANLWNSPTLLALSALACAVCAQPELPSLDLVLSA